MDERIKNKRIKDLTPEEYKEFIGNSFNRAFWFPLGSAIKNVHEYMEKQTDSFFSDILNLGITNISDNKDKLIKILSDEGFSDEDIDMVKIMELYLQTRQIIAQANNDWWTGLVDLLQLQED